MTLDLAAAAANDSDLAEAKQRTARYTAKDKAAARSNVANPAAALTEEKREWIESKRRGAIQRVGRPKTHIDLPADAGGQTGVRQLTSAENKAAIYAKIRSGFAYKRLPSDDDGLLPPSRKPRGGLNGSAQRDAEEHRTQEPGTAERSVTDLAAVPGRGGPGNDGAINALRDGASGATTSGAATSGTTAKGTTTRLYSGKGSKRLRCTVISCCKFGCEGFHVEEHRAQERRTAVGSVTDPGVVPGTSLLNNGGASNDEARVGDQKPLSQDNAGAELAAGHAPAVCSRFGDHLISNVLLASQLHFAPRPF